jgi:hypothetical protein
VAVVIVPGSTDSVVASSALTSGRQRVWVLARWPVLRVWLEDFELPQAARSNAAPTAARRGGVTGLFSVRGLGVTAKA